MTTLLMIYIFQMTIACMVNTYFMVRVPDSNVELFKLSILPFSIHNAIQLQEKQRVSAELLDDLTTL